MASQNAEMNVLLIVADQWRGDFMPQGRGGLLDLPNLAELCRQGTRFSRHFANATPCAPARMSMLTGQYMMNHRVVRNGIGLDRGKTNLALELRANGRLAGLIGYTSWIPDPRVTARHDPRYSMFGAVMPGWTSVRPFEEPEFEAYFGFLRERGYALPDDPFDLWSGCFENGQVAPSPIAKEHSDTAWLTDGAIEYIAGRGRAPWTLHLGYWRPHPPFAASHPYHAFISPDDLPPPVRARTVELEGALHPYLNHCLKSHKAADYLQGADGLASALGTEDIRKVRAVYCGLMREIDDHLGRLFRYLKEAGQWDDTLIVFTSDHGEMLGDHYQLGKQSVFDPAFHTPLVVRDPRPQADTRRGRCIDRFTEHVDIMPTILDWLGHPVPRQCDGLSLLPLLHGSTGRWRDNAFMELDFRDLKNGSHGALGLEADDCGIAILRGERFKYAHFAAMAPLLFDLANDPYEQRDLAGESAFAETLSDCRHKMLDWRMRNADRTLTGISASPKGLVGSLARSETQTRKDREAIGNA